MIAGRGSPGQTRLRPQSQPMGGVNLVHGLEGCSRHQTDVDLVSEQLDGSQGETQLCLPFNSAGREWKKRNPQIHCREIQNYIDSMDKRLLGLGKYKARYSFWCLCSRIYTYLLSKRVWRGIIIFPGHEDALLKTSSLNVANKSAFLSNVGGP